VIDAQCLPAAVVLDAIRVIRAVAEDRADPHIFNLQDRGGEGARRHRHRGVLAADDAVVHGAVDAVQPDPFQVQNAAGTNVVAQLNSITGCHARREADQPADPDDVVAALDDDRMGQHDGVL